MSSDPKSLSGSFGHLHHHHSALDLSGSGKRSISQFNHVTSKPSDAPPPSPKVREDEIDEDGDDDDDNDDQPSGGLALFPGE